MGRIELETLVNQPKEVCFDLSRSIDLHMRSATGTKEKAIDGVTSGLVKLNDEVLWEAWHFGLKWNLRVKITQFDRPNSFRDSQVKGIFKWFNHDHIFIEKDGQTLMREIFDFQCPFGPAGYIADPFVTRHMRSFLIERNRVIKQVAESPEWQKYISI